MANPFGTGAFKSPDDPRTVNFAPTMAALYTLGGINYLPQDIENQHTVGICTAISLTQNQGKANHKKYSADFQYLLQKKFYDAFLPIGFSEGSSIITALKVGKRFGFLPATLWTHTTEFDRTMPYDAYIAKLRAIPDSEVNRLIAACIDQIKGYAAVDVANCPAMAKAILASKAGILCMYQVGNEWFTPSSLPKDIDPLRPPVNVISGHAITMSAFDYTLGTNQVLANTWGTGWDKLGTADIVWNFYRPLEAWTITDKAFFVNDLFMGMTNPDVKLLQQFLNTHGFVVAPNGAGSPGNETTFFGPATQRTLIKFQTANNIRPAAGYFGVLTRGIVNGML